MHWFNPATLMKLVEIVPTVTTAPDVVATVLEVCGRTRSTPVLCGDRAGFIVNALLFPYLNDAVKMLEAHYATIDDVDTAMKKGCGHPMGPFALMDVVGPGRHAGDPADPVPGVPRAGRRARADAGAPRARRLPRPQDRPRLPATTASASPIASGSRRSAARAPRRCRRSSAATTRRVLRPPPGESAEDGFVVRRVAGNAPGRSYRCPGCDQELDGGTPHVVAWPEGRPDDRRHWHTAVLGRARPARRQGAPQQERPALRLRRGQGRCLVPCRSRSARNTVLPARRRAVDAAHRRRADPGR